MLAKITAFFAWALSSKENATFTLFVMGTIWNLGVRATTSKRWITLQKNNPRLALFFTVSKKLFPDVFGAAKDTAAIFKKQLESKSKE